MPNWQELQAAIELEEVGISARIVNVSTLKPVNEEELRTLAHGMKAVVTAEEHNPIGGLASVITYALRGTGIPSICIEIDDMFGQSAHSYEELLDHYSLNKENFVRRIQSILL